MIHDTVDAESVTWLFYHTKNGFPTVVLIVLKPLDTIVFVLVGAVHGIQVMHNCGEGKQKNLSKSFQMHLESKMSLQASVLSLTQIIDQPNLISANSCTAFILEEPASLKMLTLHTVPEEITQQIKLHAKSDITYVTTKQMCDIMSNLLIFLLLLFCSNTHKENMYSKTLL